MKLLIVVDYQKDFVDGSLGFPDAYKLDEKISSLIDQYENLIFTYDTHGDDYKDTYEGKVLPVSHCVKGEEGWKLYGKTGEKLSKAIKVFEKNAFGSLDLANYLKEHKEFDEIDLCGLVSNMCVFANAIMAKAANPYARVTILKDYSDSYDKALEAKAYTVLTGLHIEVK